MTFCYFEREACDGDPAGVTVSKNETLPEGEFELTEFTWGSTALWFVKADNFSSDQRQEAYEGLWNNQEFLKLASGRKA